MKSLITLVLLLGVTGSFAQTKDGWATFAKTKFDTKYNEAAGDYFLYPIYPEEVKAMVGKEIDLEGYYMPIDVEGGQYIILSKVPYSQCFFCGGAGPESIAEVYFKTKPGKFEADQFIRIKGKLKLNENDIEHLNFMVEGAVLVK